MLQLLAGLLTQRMNDLQMVVAQIKALQIVDCAALLGASGDGLDAVAAQVECY